LPTAEPAKSGPAGGERPGRRRAARPAGGTVMRVLPRQLLSGHQMRRRGSELSSLVVLAVALEVAAGVGLAYLAGFSNVHAVLRSFDWPWLTGLFGALIISFVGYYYAYRGMFRVGNGPRLPRRQLRAVVAAGFGGFIAHGGGALDQYALEASGADEEEAKARTAGLAGLEHGVLSIGATAAAIAVLALGHSQPPLDFTLPWAIIPIPGFLVAFWLAERYRDGFRDRRGWRRHVGIFLDSIALIRRMFARPRRWWPALVGMAVFWVMDAFAAWAGLAAFGYQADVAALYIGFATGMVFTRRTGPLAGAGVLALVLPVTIWSSGSPFAVAVVGIFAYRILALLLPLPVSLAALPTLRKMGEHREPRAEDIANSPTEPGLRRTA
jgi:uncharacterized membrane protein YbhN (UPF0104 family)